MNLTHLIKEREKEFDEKFGKPVPDENGELFYEFSEGTMAGCDDCYANQETRAEHKKFLQETTRLILEALRGEIDKKLSVAAREATDSSESQQLDQKIGEAKAFGQVLSLLTQHLNDISK